MTGEGEDRLAGDLGDALAHHERVPSPERVAAVRAHAERRRAQALAPPPPGRPVELVERRRRRELLTGAVAAAVGAALGAIGLEAVDDDAAPGPPTEGVAVAVASPTVAADAVLIDHTWGVEIVLTASGLTANATYRTMVQPADGTSEVSAGSFLGVEGDRPIVCRMNASILRAAAQSFTVVDDEGAAVISGRFT